MAIDGYSQYQQNQLSTTSPAKLLLAAYDGAIRFCRIGLEKMREGKVDEQSINLNKALAVICELLSTLNEDANPPLVARLKSLYLYVIEKLAHANLTADEASVTEAMGILANLRESWAEADRILQRESQQEAAA